LRFVKRFGFAGTTCAFAGTADAKVTNPKTKHARNPIFIGSERSKGPVDPASANHSTSGTT
jgi:hypothetical protein